MTPEDTGAPLVARLAGWLSGTDIALLELTTPDETVRIARGGVADAIAPVPAATTPDRLVTVAAPTVGIVQLGHPLRPGALVQPGQAVRAGEAVVLLRVGTLLLTVAAPHDGTIQAILADDGAAVGYGAPLLTLYWSDAT